MQTWSRQRPDLRGTVNDVYYVEQRAFRAVTSAEDGCAIRESLAVRIEVRQAGEPGCKWERVNHVERRVKDEGSEAMRVGAG